MSSNFKGITIKGDGKTHRKSYIPNLDINEELKINSVGSNCKNLMNE